MIDVPGLIEWAWSGKGLWNEFLRHILKARVFTLFVDAAKDIPWMDEPGLLLDEIREYVQQRLQDTKERWRELHQIEQDFFYENNKLRYRVTATIDEKKIVLLQKAIVFVVNKIDTMLDEEVRSEFVKTLTEKLDAYFKKHLTQKVDYSKLISLISSASREGIDGFLNTLVYLLQDENYRTIGDQEIIAADALAVNQWVEDITGQEINILIDRGYIKPLQAQKVHVWKVNDPIISYYTYVLPWWNEEAEMRYWATLGKDGHLKEIVKAGAKKGDILKIVSIYAGLQDVYILWS